MTSFFFKLATDRETKKLICLYCALYGDLSVIQTLTETLSNEM